MERRPGLTRTLGVIGLCAALSWLALIAVLAVPSCAFAQDTVAIAPALAADASGVDALAEKAFDAFAIGDWWALGSLAVFGLTLGVRSGAASRWASSGYPRVSAFFADPRVMFFVPIFLAGVPGVLSAVLSGKPFTLGLLVKSITVVSGGAKTIFLGWRNFQEGGAKPGALPAPAPTAPGGAS